MSLSHECAKKTKQEFLDTTTTTTMNTTTALNILVVDDSKNHRDAASILLKGHNLTIASSYDEGAKALSTNVDYDRLKRLEAEAGLGQYPREGTDEDKASWQKKSNELQEQARNKPNFDVVLLDLMMPASRNAQGGQGLDFVGKEMPIGTFLILLALRAGVKNIGMVTDTNHHHHPASAALDPINRIVIKVGDTRIFATNYPGTKYFNAETGESLTWQFLQSEEGKAKYPQDGYEGDAYKYKGAYSGKGWDGILKTLLEGGDDDVGA